jgi:hypothetical protein
MGVEVEVEVEVACCVRIRILTKATLPTPTGGDIVIKEGNSKRGCNLQHSRKCGLLVYARLQVTRRYESKSKLVLRARFLRFLA